MVDFDEAEDERHGAAHRHSRRDAGSGSRQPVRARRVHRPMQRILPALLADLLDAHHYTDGADFIRLGTPTNNTADRRAGYSSVDPGHLQSYATEVVVRPR